MNVFCRRMKKFIRETECCEIVINTDNKLALMACIICPSGVKLAKLCPYYERFHKIDDKDVDAHCNGECCDFHAT